MLLFNYQFFFIYLHIFLDVHFKFENFQWKIICGYYGKFIDDMALVLYYISLNLVFQFHMYIPFNDCKIIAWLLYQGSMMNLTIFWLPSKSL